AQEFKILASLRHPNIINVLDYGFAPDKQPFFTMTLLEKPQTIVAYAQEQPFEAQIDLIIQMLQALAYLHRQRILHCDLKPGNVLVNNGEVKVLDFGLALVAQKKEQKIEERVVGTIAYMSPELLQGGASTVSSDLYSVGVMMYQIFTGRHPFSVTNTSTLI